MTIQAAGTGFENRQGRLSFLKQFRQEDLSVTLEREPDNRYDRNAIWFCSNHQNRLSVDKEVFTITYYQRWQTGCKQSREYITLSVSIFCFVSKIRKFILRKSGFVSAPILRTLLKLSISHY